MGAAIEKAVLLAFELQRRKYAIGILTGTAEVVDDVIPDDNVSFTDPFVMALIGASSRIWNWIVKRGGSLQLSFEFDNNDGRTWRRGVQSV
jgi:hypothetical protein